MTPDSGHVEAIELDHRPGSVDQNADAPGKFPFAAFEFTEPSATVPKITLKDAWRFAGHDADFLGALFAKFEHAVKVDNYVITDTDRLTTVVVNAATAKTMTLPTLADNQGRILAFVNKGAGEAIIDAEGAETVQGWSSVYLSSGSYLVLMGEATEWKRIAGPLQPVSGEPSLGTLHEHYNVVLSVDPADTNWHAVDCSAQVPVGCKAIQVSASLTSAGGIRNVKFSSASAGNEDMNIHMSVVNQRTWGDGVLFLDSSRQFWYQVDNADVSSLVVKITGYYIW